MSKASSAIDKTIVLVLGDQLDPEIAALRDCDPAGTVVLMAEVQAEAGYVGHHKKKLAFIFSAMRHFAEELRSQAWEVDYITLDAPDNTGTLRGEVERAMRRHGSKSARVTQPGEWRVLEDLRSLKPALEILPDRRFVCSASEFAEWAEGRKTLRQEYFYRFMRRKTGLLMDGEKPIGGKWNFDSDNRKPARKELSIPRPLHFAPDETTKAVLELVADRFAGNFGDLEPFWLPVTRTDAEKAAKHFIAKALPKFGDYQDAMLMGEKFLYHSVLSPMINVGLLDPLALCRIAEDAYHSGDAPINAVEGFIRQIIGWREFVRGIYWHEGPDYMRRNALEAKRPLPNLYWSGETGMACLAAAIGQTREEAYAHHIQRLMVTGNFALLLGVEPHQLHEWYLAVYADAFEWVEAPNTIGMSQFADNGLLGSKPYAASGAYIARMSDYCGSCRYDVKQKLGADACPLNSLYWDFIARHRQHFDGNPRMSQMYRTWDRMADTQKSDLREQAKKFLARIDKDGTDL